MEAPRQDASASDESADVMPNSDAVSACADMVSHLLEAHGGGIEVQVGDSPGSVRVRFTGLCTSCCLRPLTVANIVGPALLAVPGVTQVDVEGSRISAEGIERLQA